MRLSLRDRRKSSGSIQEEMAQCNVKLSGRAVQHRLHEFGIHARIPQKAIFISQTKVEKIKLG